MCVLKTETNTSFCFRKSKGFRCVIISEESETSLYTRHTAPSQLKTPSQQPLTARAGFLRSRRTTLVLGSSYLDFLWVQCGAYAAIKHNDSAFGLGLFQSKVHKSAARGQRGILQHDAKRLSWVPGRGTRTFDYVAQGCWF